MQTPLIILCALVGVGAGALWLASCAKPLTIEGELAKAPDADRQALAAVLEGTGLATSQLTPIGGGVARGFGVLDRHQRAVAVEDGRIIELRLSDVPLPHPEALVKLTALQALWLSGNHLTTLPDLSPLKDLVFLDLGQNQLHDLTFAAGLSKLRTLHIAGNAIDSLAPLTKLQELAELDLTANPNLALPDPKPAKWVLKTDANPTGLPPDPAKVKPANWVQNLPPNKGKAGQSSRDGFVNQGAYSVKGTVSVLNGASENSQLQGYESTGGAGNSTLEITVEKGRVRGYLEFVPPGDAFIKKVDGYIYAEAVPGKPGQVHGILPSFTPGYYTLSLESLDGEAQGIRYHIYR